MADQDQGHSPNVSEWGDLAGRCRVGGSVRHPAPGPVKAEPQARPQGRRRRSGSEQIVEFRTPEQIVEIFVAEPSHTAGTER